MKPEVAVVAPLPAGVLSALKADFVVHDLWQAADAHALLTAVGERISGLATDGARGAGADLMDRLPRLEIVACNGVGVDAIDLAYTRERGIVVTNTPDVLTEDVADLGVALLLAVFRRICEGDRYVRSGAWLKGGMALARSVRGKRLGIVGMGRIGQAVARRAEAFGMEIAYFGPRPKPELPYRYVAPLVALAENSDALILTLPGGPATRHLVNQAVIEGLGPEGVLVNIARGSVVDEEALVAALRDGRLGAAGLDVFASEPQVPAALLRMENVVLQPHVGSATVETRGAMGDLVVANLRAHFAGRPPLTPVG
jgi:D-3-phosphoglycerate dehydrogenase